MEREGDQEGATQPRKIGGGIGTNIARILNVTWPHKIVYALERRWRRPGGTAKADFQSPNARVWRSYASSSDPSASGCLGILAKGPGQGAGVGS
jgi:hypothetical protein